MLSLASSYLTICSRLPQDLQIPQLGLLFLVSQHEDHGMTWLLVKASAMI